MIQFSVGKNEAGQRLFKLLAKQLPNASTGFLYKMLRKKNITLNGKKAQGNEIVQLSDTICYFFSDETYQKFAGTVSCDYPVTDLDIVYECEDYLVLNKPAGMLSQKAKPEDVSANEYLIGYLLHSGQINTTQLLSFRPSVCNRLDRNTSGLLVFGKTLKGLQEMSQALKERTIQKYYLALVEGRLETPMQLHGFLKKDAASNKVTITDVPSPEHSPIQTAYQPVQLFEKYTLLEVHLITGKPHQIRAHLASIGHPLTGDVKYGGHTKINTVSKQFTISYQLLHASRLVLEDGTAITAPMPELMAEIVEHLQ